MRIVLDQNHHREYGKRTDLEGSKSLSDLLSDFGPVMSEALLNVYAVRNNRELYKKLINHGSRPYFKSYIKYFGSLHNGVKNLTENAYNELQRLGSDDLDRVYSLFNLSDGDQIASKVWGKHYKRLADTRNRILREETDFNDRLPELNYSNSVNINFSYIFGYKFNDLDPRKARHILYRKTLNSGHNPDIYADFGLFSVAGTPRAAIAFYGRAIEMTEFSDLLASVEADFGSRGKSMRPIF